MFEGNLAVLLVYCQTFNIFRNQYWIYLVRTNLVFVAESVFGCLTLVTRRRAYESW